MLCNESYVEHRQIGSKADMHWDVYKEYEGLELLPQQTRALLDTCFQRILGT